MNLSILLALTTLILHAPIARAGAEPMAFDEALEAILKRSTRIAIQQEAIGAAAARNLPARLFFVPMLSIEAQQGAVASNSLTAITNQRQVSGLAKVNLFHFGSDLAAWSAANHEEESERSLLSDETLKAEQDAVGALAAVVQRGKEIEIFKQRVSLQAESLKIAQERYSRGMLARQEVEKVSVDLDNVRSHLSDAEIALLGARAELEALLGHSSLKIEWPWRERLKKFDPKAIELHIESLPSIIAARERVETKENLSRQSERAMLPSLDATLGYGATQLSPSPWSTSWTGAAVLTIPISDRLTNYSASRAQAHSRAAAEQTLEETRRQAQSQWAYVHKAFAEAMESVAKRESTLTVSRRLYEDNLRRFRAGKISANDLSVDQTRLFESEQAVVQAWSSAHLAFAKLCHAAGKQLKDCR